jgi:hypothetical protein
VKYRFGVGERVCVLRPSPFTGRLGVVERRHISHGVLAWYTVRFLRPVRVRGRDIRKKGPYSFLEDMVRAAPPSGRRDKS